jgi:hypothetical protein
MSFYTKRNDHTFESLDEIAKELVSIDPDRLTWEEREGYYDGWYNLVNQDSVFEKSEGNSRMVDRGYTVAKIMLNYVMEENEPGLDPNVAIIQVYSARNEDICDYLYSKPETYILLRE